MATANRSDLWAPPSGDRWSQPSPSEQRFFERRDSEFPRHSWTTETDLELEPDDYAPSSPRRATAARVLGAVGVIGVLALAVAAFAPRMPVLASQVATFANRLEMPWDPQLLPGPAPLPLDRGVGSGPVDVEISPSEATPTEAVTEAPTNEAKTTTEATPIEPTPVSEPPSEAPPVVPVASLPLEGSVASEADESREPPLTPEEVTRREERYEQWLKSEGLERIQ